MSCNLCVVVTRCSALVRTSVRALVCPLSELFAFMFCVVRSDDTTEWTELKLQSQRAWPVSCGSGEELAGLSRSATFSLKWHPVRNSLE